MQTTNEWSIHNETVNHDQTGFRVPERGDQTEPGVSDPAPLITRLFGVLMEQLSVKLADVEHPDEIPDLMIAARAMYSEGLSVDAVAVSDETLGDDEFGRALARQEALVPDRMGMVTHYQEENEFLVYVIHVTGVGAVIAFPVEREDGVLCLGEPHMVHPDECAPGLNEDIRMLKEVMDRARDAVSGAECLG